MSDVEVLRGQLRIDAGTLRAPRETAAGFLQLDGWAGRTGIYEYPDSKFPGGIRRELRPREQVFNTDSLNAFQGVPITIGHPPVRVNASNRRAYAVGTVLTPARQDGDRVAIEAQVDDKAGITAIKSRKMQQLSPGYDVDVVMKSGADKQYAYPGNPEGRYDAVQTNILPNHLALCETARGGDVCKLRLDSLDEQAPLVEVAGVYRVDGFVASALHLDAVLDAEARNKLRDAQFAYPEEGKLPIENAAHVQAAMSRFSQTDFSQHAGARERAFNKIVAAAKAHDIDSTNFQKEYGGRADTAERIHVTTETRNDEVLRSLEGQLTTTKQSLLTVTAERDDAVKRADAAEGALAELKKQVPELQSQLSEARIAAETVEIKKQRERADALDTELSTMKKSFGQQVRDRAMLERRVAPVLERGFKMDSLDDDQLRRVALKRLDSTANIGSDVSPDQIKGRLEVRLDMFEANARDVARVSEVLDQTRREDEKKQHAREPAWRKPLPNAALK